MELNKTITLRGTLKSNYYEHILLIVVASIGLAGSLFVFSECPDAKVSSVHTGSINQSAVLTTNTSHKSIEQWVNISGEAKAQQKLNFDWTARNPNSRYVLDMGNGERVMLRGGSFEYSYTEGGNYTLELKEITNDLISTIGTYDLSIESDNTLATSK
jgi:hypothetical protein